MYIYILLQNRFDIFFVLFFEIDYSSYVCFKCGSVLMSEKLLEGEEDHLTYANDDHERGDRSRTVGNMELTYVDIIYGRELGDDVVSEAEYAYINSSKNGVSKGDKPLTAPKKRTDIQSRAVKIHRDILIYCDNMKYDIKYAVDMIVGECVLKGLLTSTLVDPRQEEGYNSSSSSRSLTKGLTHFQLDVIESAIFYLSLRFAQIPLPVREVCQLTNTTNLGAVNNCIKTLKRDLQKIPFQDITSEDLRKRYLSLLMIPTSPFGDILRELETTARSYRSFMTLETDLLLAGLLSWMFSLTSGGLRRIDLANQNNGRIDSQRRIENSVSNTDTKEDAKKRKRDQLTNFSKDEDMATSTDIKENLKGSQDAMEIESTEQKAPKKQKRQIKEEEANLKGMESDTDDDEEYDLRKALRKVPSSPHGFNLEARKLKPKPKKKMNKKIVNEQHLLSNHPSSNDNDYAFPHRSIDMIARKLHIPLPELQDILKQIWSNRKELAISSLKDLWKSYNTKPSKEKAPYLSEKGGKN